MYVHVCIIIINTCIIKANFTIIRLNIYLAFIYLRGHVACVYIHTDGISLLVCFCGKMYNYNLIS